MASIYVRNLNPDTSNYSFLKYFRKTCPGVLPGTEAGKIIRRDGRCLHGFVNFIDAASANNAVAKKNHVIDDYKLVCGIKSKKKAPIASNKIKGKSEPQYLRQLYIGNMNVNTTNQELKEYFQKFGYVEDAHLIMDENKRSKGFGFVQFQKSSSLENVQDKRPHIINNKAVQTVRTYPKGTRAHLKKAAKVLFVSHYNQNVTEEDIDDYFSEYGIITEVSSSKKKRDDGQGDFKYVKLEFKDYDAVDKICLEDIVANHTINGCCLKVTKCLEDNFDKKQGDKSQKQNALRSVENSARNAENRNIGITIYSTSADPDFKMISRPKNEERRSRTRSKSKDPDFRMRSTPKNEVRRSLRLRSPPPEPRSISPPLEPNFGISPRPKAGILKNAGISYTYTPVSSTPDFEISPRPKTGILKNAGICSKPVPSTPDFEISPRPKAGILKNVEISSKPVPSTPDFGISPTPKAGILKNVEISSSPVSSAPDIGISPTPKAEIVENVAISSTPVPSAPDYEPVPSAPLFPLEDLNSTPYNPYFVNYQSLLYPSLPTQQTNPQPRPASRSFVSGQTNSLYPVLRPRKSYRAPPPPRLSKEPTIISSLREKSNNCAIS